MKSEDGLSVIYLKPDFIAIYEYPDLKVPYITISQKPLPLSKNFNKAVKECETKYIVRIDGDDELLINESCIRIGYDFLKKHPELKAASPHYFLKDKYDRTLASIAYPQGAGIIYDREAFLSIGGYNPWLNMQADLDFFIRFVSKFGEMEQSDGIYYWSFDYGRSQNEHEMLRARKRILKKHRLTDNQVHHFGSYAYIHQ